MQYLGMIMNGKSNLVTYVGNRSFRKSSYSDAFHCVGVDISKDSEKVSVINTNTKDQIIDFTFAEWEAFIAGVKAGEFNLK